MYKTNIPNQHPFSPTGHSLMKSNHSHLVMVNQANLKGNTSEETETWWQYVKHNKHDWCKQRQWLYDKDLTNVRTLKHGGNMINMNKIDIQCEQRQWLYNKDKQALYYK